MSCFVNSKNDQFYNSDRYNYCYASGCGANLNQTMEIIIADFEKQIKLLDKLFNCGQKFNPDYIVRVCSMCPSWVEKFFANFNWIKIASSYGEAVQIALTLFEESRKERFSHDFKNKFSSNHLRQTQKTLSSLKKISHSQGFHDVFAVPSQFGIYHQKYGFRQVLDNMSCNEFSFGLFNTLIMLLTHPERLQFCHDLYLYCAGDECSPNANNYFSDIPIFFFSDNVHFKLSFSFGSKFHTPSFGTSSGFMVFP